MKILFSGHHNPHFLTITEYLEKAIRSLGHELVIFEDRRHLIPGRIRGKLPFLERFDLQIINQRLLKMAGEARPDLAIVTGGHRILPETVEKLKKLGTRAVLWTIDAPIDFQPIIAAAPVYDHLFCQGTEAIELFSKAGITNARWLPMACDPDFHHPVDIGASAREKYGNDIVFVGSFYSERARLFEKLAEFDFAIWGPGWENLSSSSPLRRCVRAAHTTLAEWVKIYSAGKIVLATHYHDPQSSFPVYQASPRIFEALACGAFVICDQQRDVFALFEEGKHLASFSDINDLKEKINFYLNHPEARKTIAEAGQREVVANHTYIHRIKELLATIGLNL
ncbi:MAG: CgeB family protein [Syntrophales bacterium]